MLRSTKDRGQSPVARGPVAAGTGGTIDRPRDEETVVACPEDRWLDCQATARAKPIGFRPDRPNRSRSVTRELTTTPRRGRTGLCLAELSWFSPFPTIPQWKCPIVPCPSKVTLSNATSPMSIKKGSSPVRGLWSEPRPFVVTSKLSMPIICYDRRSPIFHLAVS
jgi:hypothetical protein